MTKNSVASEFGRMGGLANAKKHGKEHMKRISALAVAAKRRKKHHLKKIPLNMPYDMS